MLKLKTNRTYSVYERGRLLFNALLFTQKFDSFSQLFKVIRNISVKSEVLRIGLISLRYAVIIIRLFHFYFLFYS